MCPSQPWRNELYLNLNGFQGRHLESAMLFAVLLNLKHIFMYVAPAYFVFLLRNYCLNGRAVSTRSRFVTNSLKLGSVVMLVFLLSFGPFIYYGQLSQVRRYLHVVFMRDFFPIFEYRFPGSVSLVPVQTRPHACLLGSELVGVVQRTG